VAGVKPDFLGLFRALDRAGVEHVVVGGVAAILEGAPIATLDLDIVYRSDDENVRRLAGLLDELEARYRDPAGREIRPTASRLQANSVNLMSTTLGPMDATQRIGADWRWEDLADRSHVVKVGELEIRVLDLASIIESKIAAGRERDQAMLPVLRRTLEER
jgi:hypothetical protein